MAVTLNDPTELNGVNVTGDQNTKLGKVDNVYFDNQTNKAEWASVSTGMFGNHISLVPLAAADFSGGVLHLPYTTDPVQQAPHHDPGQALSVEQEQELFTHYGVAYEGESATAKPGQDQQARQQNQGGQQPDRGRQGQEQDRREGDQRQDMTGEGGIVGRDSSGPTTDNAMTRSEEELRAGTQTVQTGKARLRKHVVTEQQTVTVPVSHEEVTLEREEITDANRDAATSGAEISSEEHEVTLHADQPVVTTETVAKERVKIGTKTVEEAQQVSGEVRKEQIDMEPGTDETGTGRSAGQTRSGQDGGDHGRRGPTTGQQDSKR